MENAENNCEMFKSWTLIKPVQLDELSLDEGANLTHENNPSEESDGISVISEGEMYKTIVSSNESDNELDKAIEAQERDEETYRPMTPPLTPLSISADTIKEYHQESFHEAQQQTSIFSSKHLMASIAFVSILSVLYLNYRSLKSDLQSIKTRVEVLENENQILKTALDELEKIVRSPLGDEIIVAYPNEKGERLKKAETYEAFEERRSSPKTKTVWLGNEVEDKVQILDKKHNSLPDYCYFTEEDDLFHEYNAVICEGKRRKLEAKNSNEKKKSNGKEKDGMNFIDSALNLEGIKTYDDLISDTLHSLNDEIHEIKRKRSDRKAVIDKDKSNFDAVSRDVEKDEKPEKLKNSERRKKKKLQRQKEVGSSEWVDKRTNGREEARKKQEKQQSDINWYLKRKNERAAIRMESSAVESEL